MYLSNGSPPSAGSISSSAGSLVGSGKLLLGSSGSNLNSKRTATAGSGKHHRNGTWNEKKRAGMSFMIVIVFFAVFALIILVEIVMIDEKSKSMGVGGRHGLGGASSYSREAAPDYEDVKEEYSVEEALYQKNVRIIREMAQSRNVQIPLAAGPPPNANERLRFAGAAAGAGGDPAAKIFSTLPWGSLLPASIEQTLPGYPMQHGRVADGEDGAATIRVDTPVPATDAEWRIVNGTRYKFFVYSAFYDGRSGGRLVRVIGATRTRGPEKVWCRLWYRRPANGTAAATTAASATYTSATVVARVKVIRENWNLKYSACFVLCPLMKTAGAKGVDSKELVPYAVSVVSKLHSPPGNVLQVHHRDVGTKKSSFGANDSKSTATPNSIGVCIKPLHFDYDSALYLLEFLELNALLGVSHFTLYNHTIGPRAACVLQHYQQHGGRIVNATTADGTAVSYVRPTLELLPWELRMRSQKEIRTEGMFAAFNDCLYRSMYRYQFVAIIDVDEFIIPRHNETLQDLLKWLSLGMHNRYTGSYSFQNAFFYLQFADDILMYEPDVSGSKLNAAIRAAMTTQRKTRRRTKLHPQKQRSKYICKPEAVVEAGNHFVWEFVPGRSTMNVPVNAGILHHYRVCEFGGDDCIKTPSTVDRTAHKHGSALVDRVQLQYSLLKDECNLHDVPPVPAAPVTDRKLQLRKLENGDVPQTNAAYGA